MLRCDHRGYAWLYPTTTTGADQAANALVDWCAAFGPRKTFMSDGPSHFRNETMRLLSKGMRCKHHFTQAYCPWSNGSIERLGKEILRVARALISELQLNNKSWPDIIPLIQSAINHAPSATSNNTCPITAFTGMPAYPPIKSFIRSDMAKQVNVSDVIYNRAMQVTQLQKFMDDLNPVIQTSLSDNRKRIRDHMSRGNLPNFQEGDYVLVARGPRRIVK